MQTMMNKVISLLLLASSTFAVFQGDGGVVVIDPEDVSGQAGLSDWRVRSDLGVGGTLPDFTGNGYIDCNVQAGNHNPGGTGLLSYDFRVREAGRYQLQWRSAIGRGNDATEHNDSFVRLTDSGGSPLAPAPNGNDMEPGRWLKIYHNIIGRWAWDASNKDFDPKSVSWNLQANTVYQLQVACRSQHHAIDRILLWNRNGFPTMGDRDTGYLRGDFIDIDLDNLETSVEI